MRPSHHEMPLACNCRETLPLVKKGGHGEAGLPTSAYDQAYRPSQRRPAAYLVAASSLAT
jgi:hypothetical protein